MTPENTQQRPCDCRYESIEAPGIIVAPIVIQPGVFDDWRYPDEQTALYRMVPHMSPGGRYRCSLCGLEVAITFDGKTLVIGRPGIEA